MKVCCISINYRALRIILPFLSTCVSYWYTKLRTPFRRVNVKYRQKTEENSEKFHFTICTRSLIRASLSRLQKATKMIFRYGIILCKNIVIKFKFLLWLNILSKTLGFCHYWRSYFYVFCFIQAFPRKRNSLIYKHSWMVSCEGWESCSTWEFRWNNIGILSQNRVSLFLKFCIWSEKENVIYFWGTEIETWA